MSAMTTLGSMVRWGRQRRCLAAVTVLVVLLLLYLGLTPGVAAASGAGTVTSYVLLWFTNHGSRSIGRITANVTHQISR